MNRRRKRERGRDRRRIAGPARIETLEPRWALAVAASAWPTTWTIAGDVRPADPADTIVVDRDPEQPGMLRATVNDVVVARRPEARVSVIRVLGGRGDDSITIDVPGNGRIRTYLYGGAGADTIVAGDQNDVIRGGAGNDSILGGRGQDRIYGDAGNDTINGGAGNDSISGGDGNDALVGAAGDDSLLGNSGNDSLRGGDGRNTLDGGVGRDSYFGTRGRDAVRRLDAGESLIGNETTNPLRAATNLDQLKSWFIDAALARWGGQLGKDAWWWWRGGGDVRIMADGVAMAAGVATGPAATGDFSGTNNQVAGVDEGDRVKTDGQHLFVLAGDGVDILDAWPADSLQVVGHVATDGDERALFLNGTRLTVISQETSWGSPSGIDGPTVFAARFGSWQSRVDVTVIDVSDASQPVILEKTSLDGWMVDARAIDGRVLVVVQDSLDIPMPAVVEVPVTEEPALPAVPVDLAESSGDTGVLPTFTMPPIWGGGGPDGGYGVRYVYEGLDAYRARLEAAWNEDALPRFTVTSVGAERDGTVVAAGRVYLPVDAGDDALLSVASFSVDDDVPGFDTATTVAGVSGTVYASTSNLYVAAGHVGNWWDVTSASTTTNIYQFDLEDASLPLAAMGAVPGLTLNQFSLDEYDGLLRVATTDGFGDNASSGVYVLASAAGNLQTVGSVGRLAQGERIYSVRFVGDVGYVSTFRQVDPLFVIDLGTPTRPTVVGELKIPGFSSHLQPIDATHLLGVGRDVDPDTGSVLGLQLSIFDVSDPAAPRRTSTYTFAGNGWDSWSAALWDHHALSWFPDQGILALPVQQGSWWEGSSGLVVFRVDPSSADAFTMLGEITHDGDVQRAVRIGGFIYSVSADEVKVHLLTDPNVQVAAARLSRSEDVPPIVVW